MDRLVRDKWLSRIVRLEDGAVVAEECPNEEADNDGE